VARPNPTQLQRRLIGRLILAGNVRVELMRQLVVAERDLREALVHCWCAGITARHVLGNAAQIDPRTVYSWLNVEGVPTGKAQAHYERASHSPLLGLTSSEISALAEEYKAQNDRELSARLASDL
jgi:hypothetical protein